MPEFGHERLLVFRESLSWIRDCEGVARGVPHVHRHLADQLRRTSTSVVLNIAEGAGEYAPGEKRRFYRIALRSATEAAAVLPVLGSLGVVPARRLGAARSVLDRIVAMLTALALGDRARSPPRPER